MAEEIAAFGRNSRFAEPALVGGRVGIVVAPQGRLRLVLAVTVVGERITAYELIADPGRLHRLDPGVLDAVTAAAEPAPPGRISPGGGDPR
ncbi:hypothetical protein [Streptomyces sparsogenes]|uniref:hypothetical protein n=1 Tax=Streptomyces sparsogenes TaxID=67365 RepID=UPI003F4D1C7A